MYRSKQNLKARYRKWLAKQLELSHRAGGFKRVGGKKGKDREIKNSTASLCNTYISNIYIYTQMALPHTCGGAGSGGGHVTRASWEMVNVPERFVKEMEIPSPGGLYRSWGRRENGLSFGFVVNSWFQEILNNFRSIQD